MFPTFRGGATQISGASHPTKKTDSKIPPLTFSSSNYTYFVTQKKQAIGIGITQRLGSVA